MFKFRFTGPFGKGTNPKKPTPQFYRVFEKSQQGKMGIDNGWGHKNGIVSGLDS
jgi:hypothetical protein